MQNVENSDDVQGIIQSIPHMLRRVRNVDTLTGNEIEDAKSHRIDSSDSSKIEVLPGKQPKSSDVKNLGLKAPKTLELDVTETAGQANLKDALSRCTDPLQFIEKFQRRNEISLPTLRAMLPLLDLHGIPRLDFHISVMEKLRDRLLVQINETGQCRDSIQRDTKLKKLLVNTFPYIQMKVLRPVVMEILKHISDIDSKYLKSLVADRELYNETDILVKRQIWKENQSLFGDEVSPLLTQYIREKEIVLFDHLNLKNLFYTPSPKMRRSGEVVQKLANMIGNSVKLYDMVLLFLRTLFSRTQNVHYCTLRAELLMALHDLEIQDIISVDPCHKFTWCLDACIREKSVDFKRSRELEGFLDSVKQGQEQVLGDLSMILCDPYAINFLANFVLRILYRLLESENLPRDNPMLVLLLRMLSLGLNSWEIIDSQDFREPKLDKDIFLRFLPTLITLMADDEIRICNKKLPMSDRKSAIEIIENSGPIPDEIQHFVKQSSVASIIAIYYTLHTAKMRNRTGLMRILSALSCCHNDRSFEDPFLHTLVSHFIHQASEFSAEDFCTVVFDEFFYAGVARENVPRHMLKLLWYTCRRLSSHRLTTLMTLLHTSIQHNEAAMQLYEMLEKRIAPQLPKPSSSSPTSDYVYSPKIGSFEDDEYGPPSAYGINSPGYSGATPAYGGKTPAYGGATPSYSAYTPSYSGFTPTYGGNSPSYSK